MGCYVSEGGKDANAGWEIIGFNGNFDDGLERSEKLY